MLDTKMWLANEEHRRELIREAERERLVRQVLADGEPRKRLSSRALAWLKQQEVYWRMRLQARYGRRHRPAPQPTITLINTGRQY